MESRASVTGHLSGGRSPDERLPQGDDAGEAEEASRADESEDVVEDEGDRESADDGWPGPLQEPPPLFQS